MKLNLKFLLFISLVSALGGLLFGYDWVVIGGAKPFYELYFGIDNSPGLQGWAMSSALIGCLGGVVVSGTLSDRFGRKRLLIAASVLFTASAYGTGAAEAFNTFIWFRLLGGIGIGLASNLSPVYIAEVSPAKIRGRFVSINQLTIVIGILLAQIVNWQIAEPVAPGAAPGEILNSWNGQRGWRWMFWAEIVPAGLFFILMWLVPESPRWLIKKGNTDRSRNVLSRIGDKEFYENEIARIKESLRSESQSGFLKLLGERKLWGVLVIGIVLAVFQQWCGINVIFNYAEDIFSAAGYGVSAMLFNIVITGSINLVFTFAGMYLVDRIGRKTLMLIGSGGLAIIYAILGLFYFFGMSGWPMLVMVLAGIACYAMTLAPVTWVILSEIFPNRVRGASMAVSTFALWTASFVLTYTFPILNATLLSYGTFWLYGLICVLGFIFIRVRLVETRGKSLEEIEKELF